MLKQYDITKRRRKRLCHLPGTIYLYISIADMLVKYAFADISHLNKDALFQILRVYKWTEKLQSMSRSIPAVAQPQDY